MNILYTYTYIYIHTHTHTHTHEYIYIYNIYIYSHISIHTYMLYVYAYIYEKENARQHASMSWKMRAPGFTFSVANAQSVLEMLNASKSSEIASNSSVFVLFCTCKASELSRQTLLISPPLAFPAGPSPAPPASFRSSQAPTASPQHYVRSIAPICPLSAWS